MIVKSNYSPRRPPCTGLNQVEFHGSYDSRTFTMLDAPNQVATWTC